MILKYTSVLWLAILILLPSLNFRAQQLQNSPSTYITDSGDTISVPLNQRMTATPPPSPLSCATPNVLALPYNTNNGQRGIMFDITALNNITINCFDVNLDAGSAAVAIYYKVGTHVGFTTTPGAWTLIGTSPAITGATNVPTYVPVAVNVSVTAGCTVAFYITRTTSNGPLVNYTNGTAVGFVFGSNADMQVKDGTGKDYPFGASFTPRRFNGTIHYTPTAGPGGGSITGPTQVCAGASVQYNFTGAGWTSYTWTVPAGSTITAGQGTQTITVTAGSTPGNVCCTPSGPCGPGTQVCLAVTLAPSPTSTQSQVNVSCNGGNNGSATITPNPVGTYTYTWTPNVGSTSTVSGLSAGTYVVTAANAGGCSTSQTITITQPASALTATQTQTNVACNGGLTGAAQVTPAGGSPNYTYTWTPSGGNAATASNLGAGNYTCIITDLNGCTNQQTFTLTAPSAISLATSSTPSTCGSPNGSASVVASGGAGGYQYSWSPSGGTGPTESNLNGGAYVVTVTDAGNCTMQATVNVTGATTPTATITSSADILCNGGNNGSATVTGAGGNGTYTYAWAPSGGTGATESGLTAGSYTVTITDTDGCTSTDTVTLTEPPVLTATATGTDVLCFGGNSGSANASPAGGAGGYQYAWAPSGGSNANATGLTAQSYTCTITDANGCSTTATVALTEPTLLTTGASQVDELCSGGNNGSATVTPAGGAGGYQYAWLPSGGNAATASSLTAGTYTCTITDANGCLVTQTFTITQPQTVTLAQSSLTNVDCFGNSTGAISVTQSGGSGGYTYTWSPNVSTSTSASNLTAQPYTITVTDANGCSSSVTITVTEPSLVTLQTGANPNTICNGQSAALTANPGGGTGTYTVTWTPGPMVGNNQNVTPSATTTYTAVVTDGNGCTTSATSLVTVNPVPVAALVSDTTNGCTPVSIDFADASTVASPGVITQWSWDFGDQNTSTQQTPSHSYSTPGQYTVILTVTTADGCTSTITLNNYISSYVVPVAAFTASPQPTTIFNSTIYFTDSSSNASSWLWSFGDVMNSSSTQQNPSFSYGQPTCYTVLLKATSSNGCWDTISEPICIDPDVSIYVPNAFTPNDDGRNEVFLPIGTGIDPQRYQLWVFDRWGNLIFTTKDINEGWNGHVQGSDDVCQIDTYVWKIAAWDLSGKPYAIVGGVNLVR